MAENKVKKVESESPKKAVAPKAQDKLNTSSFVQVDNAMAINLLSNSGARIRNRRDNCVIVANPNLDIIAKNRKFLISILVSGLKPGKSLYFEKSFVKGLPAFKNAKKINGSLLAIDK